MSEGGEVDRRVGRVKKVAIKAALRTTLKVDMMVMVYDYAEGCFECCN